MMKRNISYHISEDRLDRACYIMQTIGIGDIIKEQRGQDEKGRVFWRCFTNTGVMLIMNEDKSRVVTLYIAEQKQVSSVYEGKTPSWVFALVRKNAQYAKMQNKVRVQEWAQPTPTYFGWAFSFESAQNSAKYTKTTFFLSKSLCNLPY